MVVTRYRHKWRYSDWCPHIILWLTLSDLQTNAYTSKFIIMCWSYLHKSTAYCCRLWCSAFLTFKVSPSNYLLWVEMYNWMPCTISYISCDKHVCNYETCKLYLLKILTLLKKEKRKNTIMFLWSWIIPRKVLKNIGLLCKHSIMVIKFFQLHL